MKCKVCNNHIKTFIKIHYRLRHNVYWPNIESPKIKDILKDFLKFRIVNGLQRTIEYMNLLFRIVLQFFGLSSGLCIYARKQNS